MLAVITGLTQIDRLNLQVAGKYIQDEYKFDTQTMGWVLGAFGLGYAIFHVLGGWLGDHFGARHLPALTVLWASVFTALTAVAPSLGTGWLSGRGRLPWCASCWVPGKRLRFPCATRRPATGWDRKSARSARAYSWPALA